MDKHSSFDTALRGPEASRQHFVGIDPAKESFMAALWCAQKKKITGEPRLFGNDPEGYEAFTGWLKGHGLSAKDVFVAVENTGRYSERLSVWLYQEGFELALVDPHSLWKAFKEDGKTDKIDSALVAEYSYRYADRLRPYAPPKALVERIRALLSAGEQLVRQKTALKNVRSSLESGAVETPSAHETIEETIRSRSRSKPWRRR